MSSERWTSDCDAEDGDSRGGEIDERGVVERVDVRIRDEFLRYQDKIIPRYCDKVCQAETSMAPTQVRKVFFDALHDANTIDETKNVKKLTRDDEDGSFSVSYKIHYSDKVHEVSGLEALEDCALDRDHTRVKCSCALGRNGRVCPPKVKAMLMENSVWTFKAFNVQCKPDDVGTDADLPVTQDDDHVEVSQPAHRRS